MKRARLKITTADIAESPAGWQARERDEYRELLAAARKLFRRARLAVSPAGRQAIIDGDDWDAFRRVILAAKV